MVLHAAPPSTSYIKDENGAIGSSLTACLDFGIFAAFGSKGIRLLPDPDWLNAPTVGVSERDLQSGCFAWRSGSRLGPRCVAIGVPGLCMANPVIAATSDRHANNTASASTNSPGQHKKRT